MDGARWDNEKQVIQDSLPKAMSEKWNPLVCGRARGSLEIIPSYFILFLHFGMQLDGTSSSTVVL